jgi:hypothetical protein
MASEHSLITRVRDIASIVPQLCAAGSNLLAGVFRQHKHFKISFHFVAKERCASYFNGLMGVGRTIQSANRERGCGSLRIQVRCMYFQFFWAKMNWQRVAEWEETHSAGPTQE